LRYIKSILSATAHLFYPHTCHGCGSDVLHQDSLLCAKCFVTLPHTNFAQHANNPTEEIFWGRLPLVAAHSEFYFAKETLIQHLVHQLKYKSNRDIGIFLGGLMAKSLLNSNRFNQLDALIPLPMFADKEKKRGYNQAAVICEGMSPILNVPVLSNYLIRQRFTKKHRVERWENVAGSFVMKNSEQLKGKNLLLVDDVVTTGATLEASGQLLQQIDGVKLNIATLMIASK
jgi:ComF family protein